MICNFGVFQHLPKWLQKLIQSNDIIEPDDKPPSSSIAKQLVETGYEIDLNSTFLVLHKNCLGDIL